MTQHNYISHFMIKFIFKLLLTTVIFLRTGEAAQPSSFRRILQVQVTRVLSLGVGATLAFSPMSIDAAVALSEPTASRTYVNIQVFI